MSECKKGSNNPWYNKTQPSELIEKRVKANTGQKRTEETKAKMRESAQNRPPVSEETIIKRAEANRGQKRTEEQKQRMSESHLNMSPEDKIKWSNSLILAAKNRPPISEETRQKLKNSESRKRLIKLWILYENLIK